MRRLLALCILLFIMCSVQAAERAKIGLVLSGGGARGIAHVGVLKVLEDLRIPIDMVAGTSMGAIVGGAYAAGMSIDDMEQLIGELDWADLFRDKPPREHFSMRRKRDQYANLVASVGIRGTDVLLPEGAISGQKLDLFLRDLVSGTETVEHFDQLPIPFRAIATDLLTGDAVVFESGPLETALRASMSIPGLIAPVGVHDSLLVDGGLVRNLPVDIVREMGADIIIAVNLGTPLLEREQLQSALGVTVQMIAILTEQNVQRALDELTNQDILILPQLGEITAADFHRGAQAIEVGIEATLEHSQRLRELSLSAADYANWQAPLRRNHTEQAKSAWVVDEIRMESVGYTNPDTLYGLLRTKEGQVLDTDILRADLQRLFGRNDFDRVNYRLLDEEGRNVLYIDLTERSWGPDYLRFGLGFEGDLKDSNDYQFTFSYLRTWVNDAGAEWQTDVLLGQTTGFRSEFHQPLDLNQRWFVAPFVGYQERNISQFEARQRLADYEMTTTQLGLGIGRNHRHQDQSRLMSQLRRISLPDFSRGSSWQAGTGFQYIQDQFDDLSFPSHGRFLHADIAGWYPFDSAQATYARASLDWRVALSREPHRIYTVLQLGARLDGELPLHDQFAMGGLQRFSGLESGHLRGQYMALGQVSYYQPVAQFGGAFGGDVFAGGTMMLGNIWEEREAIDATDLDFASSVFLGLNSFFGPLYLGYGLSERGNNAFYLLLGVQH